MRTVERCAKRVFSSLFSNFLPLITEDTSSEEEEEDGQLTLEELDAVIIVCIMCEKSGRGCWHSMKGEVSSSAKTDN